VFDLEASVARDACFGQRPCCHARARMGTAARRSVCNTSRSSICVASPPLTHVLASGVSTTLGDCMSCLVQRSGCGWTKDMLCSHGIRAAQLPIPRTRVHVTSRTLRQVSQEVMSQVMPQVISQVVRHLERCVPCWHRSQVRRSTSSNSRVVKVTSIGTHVATHPQRDSQSSQLCNASSQAMSDAVAGTAHGLFGRVSIDFGWRQQPSWSVCSIKYLLSNAAMSIISNSGKYQLRRSAPGATIHFDINPSTRYRADIVADSALSKKLHSFANAIPHLLIGESFGSVTSLAANPLKNCVIDVVLHSYVSPSLHGSAGVG
jgi:hypothetical protein